jgi:hypothetical protein
MTTQPTQPHIGAPIPGFAQRRARALIGWLPLEECALWLAGRQLNQQPNQAHLAACEAARRVVAARQPGVNQEDLFNDVPPAITSHIETLRQDPAGAQILAEAGEPRVVDLARVCAAQPQILVEDARKRVEGIATDDFAAIAEVTLPLPVPAQIPVAFDATKNAWILSSPNPNLRVAGNFSAPLAPGVMGFGFAVALQKSYLQVAGLGGRYFLRDGYHRAYGLLAAGIRYAPALVKEFQSFEQVALPQGLLPQGAYLGDRPPLLPDYLDDRVAADTSLPVFQKMVVVQGLELSSVG